MPTMSQLHIDTGLTKLSVAYKNPAYVAEEVMPVCPVDKRSDKYFTFDKTSFLSSSGTEGATTAMHMESLIRPGAEASEIDYTMSTAAYFAERYGKRKLVTDAQVAVADNPLRPDADATVFVTERLKMDQEVWVAKTVCHRSNYPSANKVTLTTGGSGTSWASYTSTASLPFTDIKNGRNAVMSGILHDANAMLVNFNTSSTLADHPLYKELYKYVDPNGLTKNGLVKNLRGLTVIEADQQKVTSAEGVTATYGTLWQDDNSQDVALIFYREMNPSLYSVTFGYTFEAPDDTTGVRGMAIKRYREEKRAGTLIEGSFLRDWKFIGVNASAGTVGQPYQSVGGYLVSSTTI